MERVEVCSKLAEDVTVANGAIGSASQYLARMSWELLSLKEGNKLSENDLSKIIENLKKIRLNLGEMLEIADEYLVQVVADCQAKIEQAKGQTPEEPDLVVEKL